MYPEREVLIEQRIRDKTPFVIGDFDKLLQTIINLIDNAAKFSSVLDKVTIILDVKENYYRILVKDRGLGIRTKDINQVTSSYFIGSNHNKEGMGLGLYLVSDIVTAHRGLLNIKSKEGKGTTVEILLPIHNYA
jgi:signal transduction histidine kinase